MDAEMSRWNEAGNLMCVTKHNMAPREERYKKEEPIELCGSYP